MYIPVPYTPTHFTPTSTLLIRYTPMPYCAELRGPVYQHYCILHTYYI
jgi:hypothetical protein